MECIFVPVMNEALISIGSNEDKEANLVLCRKLLHDYFTDITFSDTSITSPYGANYQNDFLNQLAIVNTEKQQEEVSKILKTLEKKMGRTPSDKKNGVVKIDIDLIIWNNEVIKPEDMPRSYIADLLPSLYK